MDCISESKDASEPIVNLKHCIDLNIDKRSNNTDEFGQFRQHTYIHFEMFDKTLTITVKGSEYKT